MSKLQFTTAEKIKLALMMQYRFGRSADLVTTECGHYSSDVLIVEKGTLVEFEVKVSLTDFKADFRKEKHNIFETCSKLEYWVDKMRFLPHQFYFAVPDFLVPEVLPLLLRRPYGVVAIPDLDFKPNINWIRENRYLRVVKKATAMRKHAVTDFEKQIIMKRMTSELINAKIDNLRK